MDRAAVSHFGSVFEHRAGVYLSTQFVFVCVIESLAFLCLLPVHMDSTDKSKGNPWKSFCSFSSVILCSLLPLFPLRFMLIWWHLVWLTCVCFCFISNLEYNETHCVSESVKVYPPIIFQLVTFAFYLQLFIMSTSATTVSHESTQWYIIYYNLTRGSWHQLNTTKINAAFGFSCLTVLNILPKRHIRSLQQKTIIWILLWINIPNIQTFYIVFCLLFIYFFKGREMSFFFVNQLSSRFVAADVKMVS